MNNLTENTKYTLAKGNVITKFEEMEDGAVIVSDYYNGSAIPVFRELHSENTARAIWMRRIESGFTRKS